MEYVYKDKQQPTKDERLAKKEKARWDAEQNVTERKKSDDAFRSNFARLKAERIGLARPRLGTDRVGRELVLVRSVMPRTALASASLAEAVFCSSQGERPQLQGWKLRPVIVISSCLVAGRQPSRLRIRPGA